MSSRVVSPVFIGRRGELTSLGALMDRARAQEPAFAVIGGEAGVGKTRLVREAAEQAAEAGFLVLTGQCVELGAEGLPLAPLVDALRILARTLPPQELARVLGPAAPVLARLLPELLPDAAARRPGEEIQKAQLLELVLGVLDRLSATRPVLFVVEDLHWADQSTLDLAAFLIRSLRGGRVLLVATYRSDELHRRHPLRPLLAGWERVRSVDRLELPRFDRGEVSAQLAAILGGDPAPGMTDLIFDRSGGNAYLVEELAGTVSEDGEGGLSPSLRDVLLSRVDALSPEAQRLLRVVSVAGRTVPDELLAAVAGTAVAGTAGAGPAEAELYAALREAVENHLLQIGPGGRGYAFRHALTRDAVYEDLLPGERIRLHAAYAEELTREPGLAGDEGTRPAALAYHWYAALDLPQALPAAVDAARHAMASYAPAEALRHLERALEIWPRVSDAEHRTGLDLAEVSRLAAEAAYRSGNLGRADSLLAEALDRLPANGSPVRRALLLDRHAVIQRDSGRQPAAVASLEQGLALLPADDAEARRAHAVLLATLAGVLMRGSEMERSAEVARRAVAAARAAGARGAEADAAITLGLGMAYLDEPEAGLESLRAGVALARDLDLPLNAVRGYVNLSDVVELLGRHEEAASAAGAGLELAERAGLARTLGSFLIGNQAEPLLRLGQWDRVDDLLARSMNAMPEGVFAATLHHLRAELAVMRGRYDDAAADLREGRRVMGETDDAQFTQPYRYLDAMIALSRGDLGAARAALDPALDGAIASWQARYAWPVLWAAMRVEAEAAIRARDRRQDVPPEIAERCARLAALAGPMGTPAPPWRGYRALVAAEQARAAGAGQAAAWAAAVAAWRAAGEPYPLAYALLRLAEAHAGAADRPAMTEAVREAHEIAARIGAGPVAAEAAALARRARLNLDPETAQDEAAPAGAPADELARFGLTEREREVLARLAAGRSNPEIARELFISAKTASVHVSNILAKLGVSGRVEAATVAHRLGIEPP